MDERARRLEVLFFRSEAGNEPVRDWLLELPKHDRKIIGDDILKMQYCGPIGKPLVGNLGNALWEVRSQLSGRIARMIFYIKGGTIVLLHGFIKKSQKTPQRELAVALKRKKQLT